MAQDLKDKRQKLQEQIAKLKARDQALASREKQAERKKRTRELIEVGAIVEKYFGSRDKFFIEAMCQIITKHQNYDQIKNSIEQRAIRLKEKATAE